MGVPREFIDQKKVAFEAFNELVWQEELKKKKEEAEKVQAELKRRKWWAQELSACSLLGWEVAEGRVRGGGAAGESCQGAVTAQGRPSLSKWGLVAVGRSDRTERGRGPLEGDVKGAAEHGRDGRSPARVRQRERSEWGPKRGSEVRATWSEVEEPAAEEAAACPGELSKTFKGC